MTVVYDAASFGNLIISLAAPILPLAICLLGYATLRTMGQDDNPRVVRAFVVGSLLIFVAFACIFWGNAIRVEYYYMRGNVYSVEGTVSDYRVSDDGKFVEFTVKNVSFNVSCCSPSPVYRGTPTDGLSPNLLRAGMFVHLTYLNTGEIVRIVSADS